MESNSGNSLKRGILVILMANIINMVFSLVTNFVLPKYLSVESYAVIKTFQMYVSYAGLFHLGFSDGIYLHYGGKTIEAIDREQLAKSTSTLRIFQFAVLVIVLLCGFMIGDYALAFFAVDLLGYNMMGYFKNIFQALGEFKKYSRILNMVAVFNFVGNMFFISVVRTDNPFAYLTLYVGVDYLVWILLEIKIAKILGSKPKLFSIDWHELVYNVKDGILLLLGNLTSIIMTSMDRWFTKILLTTLDFAQYSFAVSVENMLNVAISPVTVTLYNYLCKKPTTEKVKQLQSYIVIFATVLVAAFFPAKFIVEIWLDKYIDATAVIAFLFASQIFYIVIKSIYVNMYKAIQRQRKYFFEVLIIIAIGFAFNVVCYLFYHQKESFAVGTLLSAIVWFLICQADFKDLRLRVNECVYIFGQTAMFLFFGLMFNSVIGFCGYIGGSLVMAFAFMRKPLIELIYMGTGAIKKIKNKQQ